MRSIGNMLINTSSMNHDVDQRYGILALFVKYISPIFWTHIISDIGGVSLLSIEYNFRKSECSIELFKTCLLLRAGPNYIHHVCFALILLRF